MCVGQNPASPSAARPESPALTWTRTLWTLTCNVRPWRSPAKQGVFDPMEPESMNAQSSVTQPGPRRCDGAHDTGNLLPPAGGTNGPGRDGVDGSTHRTRAVWRRRARHCAHRRAQGAGGTARADLVRDRHQHGRDRRGHVRCGAVAGRDGEDRPRSRLERDLPGQAAARRNRRPAQDRRLQDAVRAGVRRQGRRARAAQGRARRASRSSRSSAPW